MSTCPRHSTVHKLATTNYKPEQIGIVMRLAVSTLTLRRQNLVVISVNASVMPLADWYVCVGCWLLLVGGWIMFRTLPMRREKVTYTCTIIKDNSTHLIITLICYNWSIETLLNARIQADNQPFNPPCHCLSHHSTRYSPALLKTLQFLQAYISFSKQ